MSDDSGDRAAYRDSALKVAVVVATGAVGWFTTADGNPMQDVHAVTWGMLCVGCGMLLWAIGARSRRLEAESVAKERHEERKAERERDHRQLMARLDEQDRKLDLLFSAQACTMRSDLVHKAQKYIYELHWATPEEVSSWNAEWEEYRALGADGYIDGIAKQVLALPTVPPSDKETGGTA